MSSIRNTVLLYRPSLSVWAARKKDKSESVKVNAQAGAIDGAANVNKQLLPECHELEAVQKWANSFRTFVYLRTETWDDSGWRCGHALAHMDFMAEAGDRITEGYALVDALVAAYPKLFADAKFKLNHMFNAADYPTEHEVRSKYHFSIEVQPIPAAEDLRIVDGIPPAEVDKLVSEAVAHTEARLQAAMAGAYQKLYDVVVKLANTLEAYGDKTIKKFNDSLIENIDALIAVMPALNLTNDPVLAALAHDAQQLTGYALVDLRRDDAVRAAAITEARALAAKFHGLAAAPVVPVVPVVSTVATVLPAAPLPAPANLASVFGDMMSEA